MTNARLSSLEILHIHKHNDIIDIIDGIITEFARLKGTHLALPAMSLMASPFYPFLSQTACTLPITLEMGKINN